MTGPLSNITVVALEQAVAAPLATRHMADLGARVIKVERAGLGDFARSYDTRARGMSSHFVWLNYGKESIELDLKQSEDLDLLWRMMSAADVFVQNLAPRAADRLGLGPESVRAKFPRLVHCSVSGYGEGGPYSEAKAYDLLIQAEAGVLAITGSPEAPAKAGIPVADIAAGMYAFTGILAALYDRERTGRGATLHVTMLEALAEWMGYPLNYAMTDGTGPRRTGARHATIAPYGPYVCAGGISIFLAVQNDREWRSFCDHVLLRPECAVDPTLATAAARADNHKLVDSVVNSVFAGLSPEEALRRLGVAGTAHARLRTVAQVIEHPQLKARRRWRDFDSPVGPLRMLIPPTASAIWEPSGPIPALGEHGTRLRAEFPATPRRQVQPTERGGC